jgi:thiosulfate/3-mercaptopyruvate sulfurtransferase
MSSLRYQFVDCRWELGVPGRGRELYLAGHIPGAAFLDVDEDLSSPAGPNGRHPLPTEEDFTLAASRAGIGDGVFVVAYGNMGGPERLWWLLRHLGHDDCAVLGFDAWLGPIAAGEEEVEPAVFTPRPRTDDVIEADELASGLHELVVVDARLPERFRGDRTRSTTCRAMSREPSTHRGTTGSPSCRRASSSPTAAPASPPA